MSSLKDQMSALLTAPPPPPANMAAANSNPEDDTDLDLEALKSCIKDNHARVTDLFKAWDEDGNGKVSQAEFRKAMMALGFQASKTQMDTVFDQLDRDASGAIDYKELHAAIMSTSSGPAKGSGVGATRGIARRDASAAKLLDTKRELRAESQAHAEAQEGRAQALQLLQQASEGMSEAEAKVLGLETRLLTEQQQAQLELDQERTRGQQVLDEEKGRSARAQAQLKEDAERREKGLKQEAEAAAKALKQEADLAARKQKQEADAAAKAAALS